MIGRILNNRYEIIEKIGGGGMSVVYKAKCRVLNRYVAIKVLRNELISDLEFVEKFKQESLAVASLSNPNIVNIYDTGIEDDIYYIVMEYINGETLKDKIKTKGKLTEQESIKISIQIAKALRHAHNKKIVHRDIKPHNILLTKDNIVKVADFGIARAVTSSTINNTSSVMGSVHYFSPEQARGGYVDEKSDIYSLGVVMYEMVTGEVPFNAENHISVAMKHIQETVKRPTEKKDVMISREYEGIILRCLEKHQSYRFQNVGELLDELFLLNKDINPKLLALKNKLKDEEIDSPTIVMPVLNDKSISGNNNINLNEKEKAFNQFFNKKVKGKVEENGIELGENMNNKKLSNSNKQIKSNTKKVKSEKDNNMTNADNFKITFVAIITAVVLVSLIGFFVVKFLLIVPEITVPDLLGKTEEEAKIVTEELGLTLDITGAVYSSDYDKGKVCRQNIEKGGKIKKTFPIEVVLSKGAKKSVVPRIIGKYKVEAISVLRSLKLDKGTISDEYDDNVPAGKIIRQDPKEGEEVLADSKVNFVISKGPKIKYVSVPQIVGFSIQAAKSRLINAGLTVGSILPENSSEYKKDIVIRQTHPAGSQVEENTVVGIVVSLGEKVPQEVEKPKDEEGNDQDNNEGDDSNSDDASASIDGEKISQINIPIESDKKTVRVVVYEKSVLNGNVLVCDKIVKGSEDSVLVQVKGIGTKYYEIYVDGEKLLGADGEELIEIVFD